MTLDQVFSRSRLVDPGTAVDYMVLAAHTMGLGTCPIRLMSAFADEIKVIVNINGEKDVVIGIALGYPDPDSAVNLAASGRAPLHEVGQFY